jgi:1-acyl-sn-glycerol-3-phosphate acyltransferase
MIPKSILFIVGTFLRIFYRMKSYGVEKIPHEGGVIIATNHSSNIDPPIIGICVEKNRRVKFIAKKELFKVPFISWVLRQFDTIKIDRNRPGGDLSALRDTLKSLKKGDCLSIFPEGTRTKTGEPLEPKAGLGLIAKKSGVPVVCARIFRSYRFPFTKRIVFKVGNVLQYNSARLNDCQNGDEYKKFSELIMQEIFSITEDDASNRA